MSTKYRKKKKNPLDLEQKIPEAKVKEVSNGTKIPKVKTKNEQVREPEVTRSKSFAYESKRPTYSSPYSQEIDSLFKELAAAPKFDYDPEKDENFLELKDIYTAQGKRAMKDSVATAAAQTGGIASSYAASAGSQAYQKYMQALGELIPELRDRAYGEYQDGIADKRKNLEVLSDMEKESYGRYLDDLDTYFKEYDRTYGEYVDDLERADYLDSVKYAREKDSRDFEYKKASDELERADALAALEYQREQDALDRAYDYESLDYRKYKDYLDRLDSEEREAYDREQDEIERAWNQAFLKAEYGDYSGLDEIGVDSEAYRKRAESQSAQDTTESELNKLMDECLNETLANGTKRERTEPEAWVALRKMYTGSSLTDKQYRALVDKMDTYFSVKRNKG